MKNTSRTDWTRIDTMAADDIDTSDIPPLPENFFDTAQRRDPVITLNQRLVLLHLEPSVFDWFRAQGDDYEDRIRTVLKQYAEDHSTQQKVA